ncbi:MAG: hypothetical protein ABJ215_09970, partial [Alphaproteobacteria bacterium]
MACSHPLMRERDTGLQPALILSRRGDAIHQRARDGRIKSGHDGAMWTTDIILSSCPDLIRASRTHMGPKERG